MLDELPSVPVCLVLIILEASHVASVKSDRDVQRSAIAVTTAGSWTITNLGPITASWTPPPSCHETTTMANNNNLFELYIYDFFASDDWGCMPPVRGTTTQYGTTTPRFRGFSSVNLLYYSPGICPEGWLNATINVLSDIADVTACCPLSVKLLLDRHEECVFADN